MVMIETVLVLLVFPGAMAFAAASDVVTMTIPNRVSLVLIAGFVVMALVIGLPAMELLRHLGAGALMLAVAFVFFAFGWIGGGDAKLAAATALWFGWGGLMEYALLSSVFGGMLTIAILMVRRYPLPQPLWSQGWAMRLHDSQTGIPYGVALALAGLALYPETVFMKALGQ